MVASGGGALRTLVCRGGVTASTLGATVTEVVTAVVMADGMTPTVEVGATGMKLGSPGTTVDVAGEAALVAAAVGAVTDVVSATEGRRTTGLLVGVVGAAVVVATSISASPS